MDFGKSESQKVKGLAIFLMVVHHLFGVEKAVSFHQNDILNYIAHYGKICVALFAFMSGYGLYCSLKSKGTLNPFSRIIKLYLKYWIVLLLLFVPFAIAFDTSQINIGFTKVILNFAGIYYTIDPNVWYLFSYIAFILIFPLMMGLVNRVKNIAVQIFLDLILFIILPIVLVVVLDNTLNWQGSGMINYFLNNLLYSVIVMIPFFSMGYIFSKYKIFSKLKLNNVNKYIKIILSICLIVVTGFIREIPIFVAYGMTYTDLLVTPLLIVAFVVLINSINLKAINVIFEKLGRLSTSIWLIHYLYCQGSLMWITYMPKYSVLILLLALAMSIVSAVIIDFIYKYILIGFEKTKQKILAKKTV